MKRPVISQYKNEIMLFFAVIIALVIGIGSTIYELGRIFNVPAYQGEYLVKVYDNDTNLPIQDAKVEIESVTSWGNRGTKTFLTDANGQVKFLNSELLDTNTFGTSGKPIFLLASKDGYHYSGMNSYSFNDDHSYIVKLNRIRDAQKLIQKTIIFYQNDKVDFLTAIAAKDSKKLINLSKDVNVPNIDFDFPEIRNPHPEKNVIGPGTALIRFYGEGGIQQLQTGYSNLSPRKFFTLENTFNAPESGYKSELNLISGGEYIARMSDGRHYVKFSTFIDKDLNNQSYAKIKFYIQPHESNNLEHTDDLLKSSF